MRLAFDMPIPSFLHIISSYPANRLSRTHPLNLELALAMAVARLPVCALIGNQGELLHSPNIHFHYLLQQIRISGSS